MTFSSAISRLLNWRVLASPRRDGSTFGLSLDRKSTRLNSSHTVISYAVCCWKKKITNVRSSLMAVKIHITIIELNALHTQRQNLFQELDAVIHMLMEAKDWGLRKSRSSTGTK